MKYQRISQAADEQEFLDSSIGKLPGAPAARPNPAPSDDEVAHRAYSIYLSERSPPGQDLAHWLRARAELIAERSHEEKFQTTTSLNEKNKNNMNTTPATPVTPTSGTKTDTTTPVALQVKSSVTKPATPPAAVAASGTTPVAPTAATTTAGNEPALAAPKVSEAKPATAPAATFTSPAPAAAAFATTPPVATSSAKPATRPPQSVTTTNTVRDLKKQAPHSPRERVAGFVLASRAVDKCRASIAGTLGEYHYDCPMDNLLFTFKSINGEQFKSAVQAAQTTEQVGAWLLANGTPKSPEEIKAWSDKVEASRLSDDPAKKAFFEDCCTKLGLDPQKATTFDWLEADDRASFSRKTA